MQSNGERLALTSPHRSETSSRVTSTTSATQSCNPFLPVELGGCEEIASSTRSTSCVQSYKLPSYPLTLILSTGRLVLRQNRQSLQQRAEFAFLVFRFHNQDVPIFRLLQRPLASQRLNLSLSQFRALPGQVRVRKPRRARAAFQDCRRIWAVANQVLFCRRR